MGTPSENIFVPDLGRVLEIDADGARWSGSVQSGRVLVDGTGVGDVGNVVLRDRILLSQDGLIVVSAAVDLMARDIITPPDIYTRGFIYVKESEELMDEMREVALDALERAVYSYTKDLADIRGEVKEALAKFVNKKIKRRPMILPVILEV